MKAAGPHGNTIHPGELVQCSELRGGEAYFFQNFPLFYAASERCFTAGIRSKLQNHFHLRAEPCFPFLYLPRRCISVRTHTQKKKMRTRLLRLVLYARVYILSRAQRLCLFLKQESHRKPRCRPWRKNKSPKTSATERRLRFYSSAMCGVFGLVWFLAFLKSC